MTGIRNVLAFCSNFGLNLIEVYGNIFDFMQHSFYLPFYGDITIFEVMFGVGLSTFIIATIVKWTIGIIT